MKKCPKCGSVVYEDAAEEVDVGTDEIVLDSFLAWVCSGCSYFEKIEEGKQDA